MKYIKNLILLLFFVLLIQPFIVYGQETKGMIEFYEDSGMVQESSSLIELPGRETNSTATNTNSTSVDSHNSPKRFGQFYESYQPSITLLGIITLFFSIYIYRKDRRI